MAGSPHVAVVARELALTLSESCLRPQVCNGYSSGFVGVPEVFIHPGTMDFTIACDPRCKWGVKGDHRSCVWENYVLTCMCWHVAVNWSVPCLVPRMSEAVGCVAWVVVGLQIAWRHVCIRGGVVKWLVALCSLLVFVIACYLGSV